MDVEELGVISEAGDFDYVVARLGPKLETAGILRNASDDARTVLWGEQLDGGLDNRLGGVAFEDRSGYFNFRLF